MAEDATTCRQALATAVLGLLTGTLPLATAGRRLEWSVFAQLAGIDHVG